MKYFFQWASVMCLCFAGIGFVFINPSLPSAGLTKAALVFALLAISTTRTPQADKERENANNDTE